MYNCIEYPGARDKDGYGRRDLKRFSTNRVHRQIVEMAYGPEEIKGLVVMHTCDNPVCFRFEHLQIGTVADNNWDRAHKGRHHNSNKTHCPKGHEYTHVNTYVRSDNGARRCKVCQASATASYKQRARA